MTGGLSNPSSSDLEVVGADRSETPINARDKFVVRPYSPNGIQSAYVPDASVPAPERYAGVDRPRRRWLEGLKKRRVYIESAFASLVVIGIVVGVVYGTERQRHASDSRMTDDSQPSNSTVPIGKSFNASFGVPAGNCTYTCGSSVSGYTAGVSQNLWGSRTDTEPGWACGTCWHIHAETNGQQQLINSTDIVVHVHDWCPAAKHNDLCQQTDLSSTNKYDAVVHFNLCPETGSSAAFFASGDGLGIGTATRVNCL
ncbi:hypothetical protein BKA67DRAFT_534322 [Truncatella angustata]|uniref:Expansin-like EG45 domain-containing protein n=1 Tax=Truncatella angustata TaxID=152316 RepID=A0A9P8UNH2_9PEZI|nr:uncharacterized protein BKA67DRAFT_534322 [Truncatella angustata]KAH6655395.1 hypothetical protein BKA67DRAFT_534322 [Truncatella angustata]